MKLNTSGQSIGAQMVSATDGSAFTGAVTVYVTGDAGTQAVGSVGAGACAHEGNGFHTYAPAQAETNYNHIGFTFIGTGAVPATVQVYPSFPQTGDNFARLGAPVGASISADIAGVKTQTAAIEVDTQDIQARLPAALVSGRIDASVGAMAAGVLTAAAIAADAITDAKVASDVTIASVTGSVGSVTGLTAATVHADLDDIQARLPAALVAGRMRALVEAVDVGAINADALSSDAGTEIGLAVWNATTRELTAGTNIVLAKGVGVTGFNDLSAAQVKVEADDAIADAQLATAAALATVDAALAVVAGYIDTEVAAIKFVTDRLHTTLEGGAGSPGEFRFSADALINAPVGSGGGGPSAAVIADAVWDELLSGHAGVGSAGAALSAAGSAGDPWSTPLPGAYGAGTAGKIVGDNVNATISSRATQASVDVVDGIVDSILVDTGTDIPALLVDIDNFIDTEVAAIKAKTDLIPAAPAAVGDVPTATQNADALLNRDMSAVSDTNARSPLNALRFIRNKWDVAGGTLTVTKENDVTTAWTAAVSTSAGADPIVGNDPA